MPSSSRRPAEYKQMALETAIRNPERYFAILSALVKYDEVILNDVNLLTIVTDLYKSDLVSSEDIDLTRSETEIKRQVMQVNLSRNADGGFPKGYAARFWTYMRTPSELGFVYARYNKVFRISDVVKAVLNGKLAEQEAFAIQAFKGNRRSPYRNVNNDYNFFKFMYEILKHRQAEGHLLTMEQLILATFSRSGDVNQYMAEIAANKFNGPDDVYRYLQLNYGVTTKLQTVTRDYPDVVIRLLVIMGMVSIKYSGVKLIGLNQNKTQFFDELLKTTPHIKEDAKEDASVFFKELNTDLSVYEDIIARARDDDVIIGSEYTAKLLNLMQLYSLTQEKIVTSLQALSRNQDVLFKEMPAPLRLEFYTALLVASVYGEQFEIRPNYKADHEGKPYSHAPGGGGDIDVFSESFYWLIEVTLIQNRQQQQNNETTTVFRHMTSNTEFSDRSKKYLTFIAPHVHADTQEFFEHATIKNRSSKITFGSYTIDQFITATTASKNFDDMELQTKNIIDKFRAELSIQ